MFKKTDVFLSLVHNFRLLVVEHFKLIAALSVVNYKSVQYAIQNNGAAKSIYNHYQAT